MADPKETVLMLDHDEDTIRIDTRSDAYASQARRAGLKEITTKGSGAYMRFLGVLSTVNVRVRRKRVADPENLARLRLAREKKSGQISTPAAKKDKEPGRQHGRRQA